jgi:hypothetical protein
VPGSGMGARLTLLVIVLTACFDTRAPARDGGPIADLGHARQADTGARQWKIVQAADFNDDDLADALWTDPGTGEIAVTLLWGTHLLEAGPAIPGPAGGGWAPITAAEFTFDGMADVPWFNATSPQLTLWLMSATHLDQAGAHLPGPSGGGWAAVMAGDLDGDGMADVLWYNASKGRMVAWLMRSTDLFEHGPELPAPAGDGWVVPTIGDFNGDGMGDILWFDGATNRIAVWLMCGAEILDRGPEIPGPPGKGWVAVTGADFNGDGLVDVIWNNPDTNRMAVWLMRGTSVLEPGAEIAGPSGAGWSIGSAGDTDGDGMADAMWQNVAAGQMAVWTMNGTHVVVPGQVIPGPP